MDCWKGNMFVYLYNVISNKTCRQERSSVQIKISTSCLSASLYLLSWQPQHLSTYGSWCHFFRPWILVSKWPAAQSAYQKYLSHLPLWAELTKTYSYVDIWAMHGRGFENNSMKYSPWSWRRLPLAGWRREFWCFSLCFLVWGRSYFPWHVSACSLCWSQHPS